MPRRTARSREPIRGHWRAVVFAADCDEDGNCPKCGTDFAECPCPGPTQDGYEYRTMYGRLYARALAGEPQGADDE